MARRQAGRSHQESQQRGPHQHRNGGRSHGQGQRPGQRPHAGHDRRPGPRDNRPRDLDLIEGRRAVAEALDAHLPIRRALVQTGSESDSTIAKLVMRLEKAGAQVEEVPRSLLDKLSSHGAHQGIVVEAKPFKYASLETIISRAGKDPALVIVLDHVTDEGNFGAIVRSAEVVGAAGVVVANARAARMGVGAYKTSAGAVFNIPIAQVPNLVKALEALKDAGFWVAGATEHASQTCWDAPLEGRIALVMGSEGEGISRLVREKCDFLCKLPQRGVTESLNVAQATTVLAYEWLRRTVTAGKLPLEGELDGSFGDEFDLGGDRMNADLPPAGAPSRTGSFRPVYAENWNADDLDIGGDPL